jgi:hypothetical protein
MNNPASVLKMRNTLTGRKLGPHSKDHKQKIADANKLYWSDKTLASKRANKRYENGHFVTNETKQKISESLKAFFARRKNVV